MGYVKVCLCDVHILCNCGPLLEAAVFIVLGTRSQHISYKSDGAEKVCVREREG